jgi:hypothetical protein
MQQLEQTDTLDTVVSTWTSRIIGYNAMEIKHDLFQTDLALKIKSESTSMIVSLYELMGVMTYGWHLHGNDSAFGYMPAFMFRGPQLSVTGDMQGAAVVFQHKVADSVSIPTRWFFLGPTLRAIIEHGCSMAGCTTSNMKIDVDVCKMTAML